MLSIYLDIVDEAKRAINKNIWYATELLPLQIICWRMT